MQTNKRCRRKTNTYRKVDITKVGMNKMLEDMYKRYYKKKDK